jgi:hypothetical protein
MFSVGFDVTSAASLNFPSVLFVVVHLFPKDDQISDTLIKKSICKFFDVTSRSFPAIKKVQEEFKVCFLLVCLFVTSAFSFSKRNSFANVSTAIHSIITNSENSDFQEKCLYALCPLLIFW